MIDDIDNGERFDNDAAAAGEAIKFQRSRKET